MIKCYLKGRQREWDRDLDSIAGAYQVTALESTGMNQNLLIFDRETQLRIKIVIGSEQSQWPLMVIMLMVYGTIDKGHML